MVKEYRFAKIRRTMVDVSSAASRRDGVMMYRPGRVWLRWIPWALAKLAWLPWPGKRVTTNDTNVHECLGALDELQKELGEFEYATIYLGNGGERSKYCVKAKIRGHSCNSSTDKIIVKIANTSGGAAAIRQECDALRRLAASVLRDQVPRLIKTGTISSWTWSAQTCLPSGSSPNKLTPLHYEFLEKLKWIRLSHGDFAPWNCSIVDGRLYVYDWEEADAWEDGKDESWFKKQVKELLGIDA